MTGRATPRLAQPCTFLEHEAARPTARRFHHQTLLAMMQTFPYMRQMGQDVLLRDAHACREFFGCRRPFEEDVDDYLTNRLRQRRSPLVDPIIACDPAMMACVRNTACRGVGRVCQPSPQRGQVGCHHTVGCRAHGRQGCADSGCDDGPSPPSIDTRALRRQDTRALIETHGGVLHDNRSAMLPNRSQHRQISSASPFENQYLTIAIFS
jgi:hypothetical protein